MNGYIWLIGLLFIFVGLMFLICGSLDRKETRKLTESKSQMIPGSEFKIEERLTETISWADRHVIKQIGDKYEIARSGITCLVTKEELEKITNDIWDMYDENGDLFPSEDAVKAAIKAGKPVYKNTGSHPLLYRNILVPDGWKGDGSVYNDDPTGKQMKEEAKKNMALAHKFYEKPPHPERDDGN